MVLIDLDTLNVPLSVGEKEVVQLKRGQSATIHIDVLPLLKIQGVVNNVSPTVDQTTRMFGVEVTFPNPDGVLKAGMYAKVEIVTGTYEEVLIVPEQAVTVDSIGRRVVYVVKDDIVRIQEVMLGRNRMRGFRCLADLNMEMWLLLIIRFCLFPGASVIVRMVKLGESAGFAVKRPVTVIMIVLFSVVLRIISLTRLPIDLFPT